MSTSSRVSASAVLTVFLFGFASLPASAAGLCYDSGTHSMVPCGGSGVPESVEQVINNATQQAVDTAIQNATEAATRAAESAAAEQASTATENTSPATPQAAVSQAPTISSLDDLFANVDYFLNLPLDSDIVQKACGSCDGFRWARIQSELRRAAALWTSGMTAAEVAFVEGRMSSIMSDNRGQNYWLEWSLPTMSPDLQSLTFNVGLGGRSTQEAYLARMKMQFEAAGGKYPW